MRTEQNNNAKGYAERPVTTMGIEFASTRHHNIGPQCLTQTFRAVACREIQSESRVGCVSHGLANTLRNKPEIVIFNAALRIYLKHAYTTIVLICDILKDAREDAHNMITSLNFFFGLRPIYKRHFFLTFFFSSTIRAWRRSAVSHLSPFFLMLCFI